MNLVTLPTEEFLRATEPQYPRKAIEYLPIQLAHDFGTIADISKHLGFVFGGPVDHLFRQVQTPPGWTVSSTAQVQWDIIRDPQGRKRGMVFHKWAEADWYLARRYVVQRYTGKGDVQVSIIDTSTREPVHVIGEGPARPHEQALRDDWRAYYCAIDRLESEAREWIDANYPDHENVFAYWD